MRAEGSALRPGWQNRPVVLDTDEREVRTHLRTLGVFVLAIIPAVFYLVTMNETRKVSYELTEVQLAYEGLIKEERELAAERARLESLQDIEAWALGERGLCTPVPQEVVVLSGDRD